MKSFCDNLTRVQASPFLFFCPLPLHLLPLHLLHQLSHFALPAPGISISIHVALLGVSS